MTNIKRKTVFIAIFATVSLFIVNIASGNKSASVLKGPDIKVLKVVGDCSNFEKTPIHPTRYVLSNSKINPFPPPVIYDIYEDKLIDFPLRNIPGIPVPPDVRGDELKKLKLEGKYWRMYHIDLVMYRPEKDEAGIVMKKDMMIRTVNGAPDCKICGEKSKLVEKYHRYYCYKCRKYIKEDQYLKDVTEYVYVSVDIRSKKIKWQKKIGEGRLMNIGTDPEGKYFYFSDSIYFYKTKITPGKLTLYRLDLSAKKVDWNYTIDVPVRKKENTAGSYSISAIGSPDMKKIVFWEYDEEKASGSGKGWLTNPSGRAIIVDTEARSHFAIPAPLTAYGHIFDTDNRYLIFGSNQTGYLHRIDLALKKEDLKTAAAKNIFNLTISAGSKYIYVFTKSNVEVRSYPSLKLIKKIPLDRIFRGITKLLVSEKMYSTSDGRYAVIGVLKKGRGPWASSDKSDGFQLLMIGE